MKLTVATVLDEFSKEGFSNEFNLIDLDPENCIEKLKESNVDLLFIESAWRACNMKWRLAVNKGNTRKASIKKIEELTNYCKKQNIPTLFWSKEDPPHFSRFFPYTKYFDYIATTDRNCVKRYKKLLKHNNVFVLPFAAQPKIHKYSSLGGRVCLPCFAGSFRSNYKRRVEGMRKILKPAMQLGLHIYDRYLSDGRKCSFPKEYRSAVIGGLKYSELLKEYTNYRVFLNIDSIFNSPTMLSRRVFELLACGTPVISYPSKAIMNFNLPVHIVMDEKSTIREIKKLINSDDEWKKSSIKGFNRVIPNHTYSNRFYRICKNIGLNTNYSLLRLQKLEKYKETINASAKK